MEKICHAASEIRNDSSYGFLFFGAGASFFFDFTLVSSLGAGTPACLPARSTSWLRRVTTIYDLKDGNIFMSKFSERLGWIDGPGCGCVRSTHRTQKTAVVILFYFHFFPLLLLLFIFIGRCFCLVSDFLQVWLVSLL